MTHAARPDIGKYHIIELVGEGAMGVVYRASDSVLDRTVAIKVMNESIARQEDLRKRFLHEAQAAASLQHPNVVSIYDMGEVEGHMFIAMEFVDGVDLEKLLETNQPLSLQAKLDIIIDVLTGLTFAHKRGIIHRDIKPANIRVTEDGRAKIMDFGVAHLASSSMTSTGSFLGTPSYMAPEQITEGKTTAATDIFAVGGVLYQLLTQLKPFEAPTLQNLFFRIITEKPKRVSELMPNLPPALDRIVEKAMAKEPSGRYGSALEMANELSAVRAKLSGPAYPESVSLTASVSSAIELARKKSRNRSRTFAFAGGGALAAAIILVAWSELSKTRSPANIAGAEQASAGQTAAVTPSLSAPPATLTENSTPAPAATLTQQTTPPASAPKTRSTQTVSPKVTPPKPAPRTATRLPEPPARNRNTQAVASAPTQALVQPPATNPVQQQPVSSPPPAPVIQRPVETKPQEPTPAPVFSPPTASDIAPVVEAYARAIESREIGAIRRVNPGLTSSQQKNYEDFFQGAKNINVTFHIQNFEPAQNSAEARLVGTYEYVGSDGRDARLPVSFAATFERSGSGWRLSSVH
jgi:eukaryotic-like serine/threonine-protein kinase